MKRLGQGLLAVALLAFYAGPAPAGMVLTAAGTAEGFQLTTFASGFPSDPTGVGPLGIAFPNSGGVLVTDWSSGSVYQFPNNSDGQKAGNVPFQSGPPNSPYSNPAGLTKGLDGNVYMNIQFQSNNSLTPGVYQINDNGSLNRQVTPPGAFGVPPAAPTPAPLGITTNPTNGHLFVSSNGSVFDVNPTTGNAINWSAANNGAGNGADGLTFSPDGKTLYVAIFGKSVAGYNTSTGALTFQSANINTADAMALGFGSLTGKIYVNTNDGRLVEVNLSSGAATDIATGGSRGDFVEVDPNNGSLLLTQSDSILRLTPPDGGSFNPPTVPEPASLTLLGIGLAAMAGYGYRRKRTPR